VRGPVLTVPVCTGIQVLPKCFRDPPFPNFLRGPTDVDQKSGTHRCPNGDPGMTFDPGQRRGDVEIRRFLQDAAGSRSLVFDLSITHDRIGSNCHVQQHGLLSHPQDLDAPLRLVAHRKINSYRQ
jgi:hypothetical protein